MASNTDSSAWVQLCVACQTPVAALSKKLDQLSRSEALSGHVFTPHLFHDDLIASQASCCLCADIVSRGIEKRVHMSRMYLVWVVDSCKYPMDHSIKSDHFSMELGPHTKVSIVAHHSLANRGITFTPVVSIPHFSDLSMISLD
jgi:hypothetical protein